MPYIARTDGGLTVLEMRQGVITDIPEAERTAWRPVSEIRPYINQPTQIWTSQDLVVSADGALVSLVWQVADLPAPLVRMRIKEYAASVRWGKQQQLLTLPNGTTIDASEASKNKIQQALTVLEKGWATTLDFKADSGWIVVDLAGLTAVAQALVAREQALFTTEKAVAAAIDAGTITTTAQVDGWAWP